jgi:hypothetical protein
MKINLEKISNRNKNTSSELCFSFNSPISTEGRPLTRSLPTPAPSASNPLTTYHSSLSTSLIASLFPHKLCASVSLWQILLPSPSPKNPKIHSISPTLPATHLLAILDVMRPA